LADTIACFVQNSKYAAVSSLRRLHERLSYAVLATELQASLSFWSAHNASYALEKRANTRYLDYDGKSCKPSLPSPALFLLTAYQRFS